MLKANGLEITLEGSDWAIEFDEWIYEARSQFEALRLRRLMGGRVITRDVYVTDWRPADGRKRIQGRSEGPQSAEAESRGSAAEEGAEAGAGEDSPEGRE